MQQLGRLPPRNRIYQLGLGTVCARDQCLWLADTLQRSVGKRRTRRRQMKFWTFVDPATPLSKVEQPVGTGFSIGTPNATNEEDIASDFVKFFKNFEVRASNTHSNDFS